MGGTGGPHGSVTDAAAVAAVSDALAPAVPDGAGVVLAVSGGGDSVGMAHLVHAARPDLDARVVHIRHGLRDDAADAEAARIHARALGLEFSVVPVSVDDDGTGPENAARTARLAALDAAAQAAGANFVFTGHTADDNAETMLLNIARGTGLAGLAGIPSLRRLSDTVMLARPVLGLRRAVVRAVAASTRLPIAEDPTNTDPQQRRARARSDLLPLLQSLTGGDSDAVDSLTRLAGHARSDAAALDTIAAQLVVSEVRWWGPVAAMATDALGAVPAAVAQRVVRQVVTLVHPGPPPSRAAVTAVLALSPGQAATLADGIVASLGGSWLAIGPTCDPLPVRRLTGTVLPLPEVGVELRCDGARQAGTLPPWAPATSAATVAVASADLLVRSREPGDRIVTAAGTQTLADAMIDAGVPRIARDLVPVVVDSAGPLWVPGVAVRADTAGDLHLRLASAAGK